VKGPTLPDRSAGKRSGVRGKNIQGESAAGMPESGRLNRLTYRFDVMLRNQKIEKTGGG